MKDWIKKALTKRIRQREIQPDPRLVYGVKFSITALAALVTLQITHLIVLKQWNSEVFSAITALTGTLTGILITQKT